MSLQFGAFSIGTRKNIFWSVLKQFTSNLNNSTQSIIICFTIGLDLDSLILVLSFEIFLSTFVKIADFQEFEGFADIFLLAENFL